MVHRFVLSLSNRIRANIPEIRSKNFPRYFLAEIFVFHLLRIPRFKNVIFWKNTIENFGFSRIFFLAINLDVLFRTTSEKKIPFLSWLITFILLQMLGEICLWREESLLSIETDGEHSSTGDRFFCSKSGIEDI